MSQLTLDVSSTANVHGQKRHDVGFKQVTLFAQLIADRVSIKPGQLWQITAGNGGSKWQFPIQFTELEARLLLPYLQSLDWWEFDDRGVPIQVRRIHAVIESMVVGRGGISGAIAAKLTQTEPSRNKAKQGGFSQLRGES